jgi:hypothetical protein
VLAGAQGTEHLICLVRVGRLAEQSFAERHDRVGREDGRAGIPTGDRQGLRAGEPTGERVGGLAGQRRLVEIRRFDDERHVERAHQVPTPRGRGGQH